MLLDNFLKIVGEWSVVFCQQRTLIRAVRQALCLLSSLGRRTISRAIMTAGRDKVDWSADYRLFSRSEWLEPRLFDPILRTSMGFIDGRVVSVAFDDTKLPKTGKKIRTASWQRDPMSPPFHVNFILGLRFLQASILLPLYLRNREESPRAIPIRFKEGDRFAESLEVKA